MTDRFTRIVDQRYVDGSGNVLQRYQYGYDEDGNRLWRQDLVHTSGHDEHYEYDSLNRLIRFQRGTLNGSHAITAPILDKTWNLDALGNWTSLYDNLTSTTTQTRTHNRQNQIEDIDSDSLSYDYNGNLTSALGLGYTYDAWNRLVGAGDAEYRYDALGRRAEVVWTGLGVQPAKDFYYSAEWQVLEEWASGQLYAEQIWSPLYVDQMIARFRDADDDGSFDELLYALHDANYNVTALANYDGATIVERYEYDPYGTVTYLNEDGSAKTTQASAYDWVYLHQGGRYDTNMHLYDFRRRAYSADLGRWMQQDPLSCVDGLNLYAYLVSNPTSRRDPMGLSQEGRPPGGESPPHAPDGYHYVWMWNDPPLPGFACITRGEVGYWQLRKGRDPRDKGTCTCLCWNYNTETGEFLPSIHPDLIRIVCYAYGCKCID